MYSPSEGRRGALACRNPLDLQYNEIYACLDCTMHTYNVHGHIQVYTYKVYTYKGTRTWTCMDTKKVHYSVYGVSAYVHTCIHIHVHVGVHCIHAMIIMRCNDHNTTHLLCPTVPS